jgi:hypothetical protein
MGLVVHRHYSRSQRSVCYNTEGDRNLVVSQVSCRMGWILLELQTETVTLKITILKILREDLHLRKITSKGVPHALTGCHMHSLGDTCIHWVSHALTEVEK